MTTYVTYFDRNYVACGVALLDSLFKVAPGTRIIVWALGVETERQLNAIYRHRLCVLEPDYVAKRWPNLGNAPTPRLHWETLAMRKLCLMLSILREMKAPNELLFYVDSDCMFNASPDKVLDAMASASIGISTHGFSPDKQDLVQYGIYNAGLMVLRNDELGRTCMREWADDCFRWCHARVEDGKFMNQGYLNRWPNRYPGVVMLDHPGRNLAT